MTRDVVSGSRARVKGRGASIRTGMGRGMRYLKVDVVDGAVGDAAVRVDVYQHLADALREVRLRACPLAQRRRRSGHPREGRASRQGSVRARRASQRAVRAPSSAAASRGAEARDGPARGRRHPARTAAFARTHANLRIRRSRPCACVRSAQRSTSNERGATSREQRSTSEEQGATRL